MNLIAIVAVSTVALTGCATITRGTNDVLVVNTSPSQADVVTTNGFACQSPCALKMPRKSEFDVTISKAGYQTAQAHITNAVSGGGGAAMAGNVFLGGIIGAGVDAGTGAMLELRPNPLNVTLEPLGPQVAETAVVSTPVRPTSPVTVPATIAAAPATAVAQQVTPAAGASPLSLPPVPTQTTKLPGHRVAGNGCPGFAPRVLYAESPEKLPRDCESVAPL